MTTYWRQTEERDKRIMCSLAFVGFSWRKRSVHRNNKLVKGRKSLTETLLFLISIMEEKVSSSTKHVESSAYA